MKRSDPEAIELTDAELRAVICGLESSLARIAAPIVSLHRMRAKATFGDLRTANAGQRALRALKAGQERRKG